MFNKIITSVKTLHNTHTDKIINITQDVIGVCPAWGSAFETCTFTAHYQATLQKTFYIFMEFVKLFGKAEVNFSPPS